jgi:25S rRNA (adenine2142-N1)-methyltransferase
MKAKTKRKRQDAPLVPPPQIQLSRKKARRVTTLFHKLTRALDAAVEDGDESQVNRLQNEISSMGGRTEYQKASQVSTFYHSTSKWVLGYLSRNGWLYGRMVPSKEVIEAPDKATKKQPRRLTRLLEVGAINTELLDTSQKIITNPDTEVKTQKYRLDVRAVDLHAMDDRIQEVDFLTMNVPQREVNERYDVLVCSMVLNCVTTAERRGEMVCRLYHFLRPSGLCFVTTPRTCLNLSPYINQDRFLALLRLVGFEILERKESPKVAFFVCGKPAQEQRIPWKELDSKWAMVKPLRQGKKFRNDFAIALTQESYEGRSLTFEAR